MALFSLRKIKRIKVRHLGPLIGLALFLLALLILNRALGENSYQDILRYIADFPPARISGAIALTALSYFILTLYDHLALRYLQKNIGKIRVSLASFISYCFSRNLGFALLTGAQSVTVSIQPGVCRQKRSPVLSPLRQPLFWLVSWPLAAASCWSLLPPFRKPP